MKRKMAVILAAAAAAAVLAGCSGKESASGTETDVNLAEETEVAASEREILTEVAGEEQAGETDDQAENEEENYDTGDASLDNPRNQDGIGEKELLAVSFGTSYNDSRRRTIGAIEDALEEAFPEYSVRRGFTSQIIIDRVKSRDQIEIDNVTQALERAASNGVKRLVVQPTHLMNGLEYNDLVDEVAAYSDAFQEVTVGEPLLTSDEDFQKVIQAVVNSTAEYDDGQTAICLMGHGTEAESNQVYGKMQEMFKEAGYANYYVGTVEASPSLDDVMAAVKEGEYENVVLMPLMIVAGDHANNDMAGDEEGSWKRTFEDAGYQVTCILKGLGELKEIQQIFAEHAQAAMDSLTVNKIRTVSAAENIKMETERSLRAGGQKQ